MSSCRRLAITFISNASIKNTQYGIRMTPIAIRGFKQKAGSQKSEKATEGDNKRGSDKKEGEAINKFIAMAEAAKNWKPPYTEEELAAHAVIAKEHARQNMRRTNKFNKDLSTKIWLMQEALRSMPPALAANALVIDETPPPPDRPWPFFDTPPIPGFNAKDYVKGNTNDDEDGK
jgi:hypothetical protein